jgi:hypothetical protein
MERAIYNLAIASDGLAPETFNSIYERNVTKSVGYQALPAAACRGEQIKGQPE